MTDEAFGSTLHDTSHYIFFFFNFSVFSGDVCAIKNEQMGGAVAVIEQCVITLTGPSPGNFVFQWREIENGN